MTGKNLFGRRIADLIKRAFPLNFLEEGERKSPFIQTYMPPLWRCLVPLGWISCSLLCFHRKVKSNLEPRDRGGTNGPTQEQQYLQDEHLISVWWMKEGRNKRMKGNKTNQWIKGHGEIRKPDCSFSLVPDHIQELLNVVYERLEKESSPAPNMAWSRTGLARNLTGRICRLEGWGRLGT